MFNLRGGAGFGKGGDGGSLGEEGAIREAGPRGGEDWKDGLGVEVSYEPNLTPSTGLLTKIQGGRNAVSANNISLYSPKV